MPPKIHCTVFEENSGVLELARLAKMISTAFLVTLALCLSPFSSGGKRKILPMRLTEFRQPIQVQSHLEMPGILVQLGHIQRT